MKTIEERALEYGCKRCHSNRKCNMMPLCSVAEIRQKHYNEIATEQKKLTLEAFDEWLCRNSWITRDENNRQALSDLRSIIVSL